MLINLEQLWQAAHFSPNPAQREAIEHVDGPLYLPAGPGSGKTRVLLWRTLNLIVFHGIQPDEIYLSTFTEKAALQLREGLRGLLGLVTARTGRPFDLGRMYVGTVHSLCQRLLADRRFYPHRQRGQTPALMDELRQYFHIYKQRNWRNLIAPLGKSSDEVVQALNALLQSNSTSRHVGVTNAIALFNRLSEECIVPDAVAWRVSDANLALALSLYRTYRDSLQVDGLARVDFSLIQQMALNVLERTEETGRVFRHVIVDEYQDTNTVQERLFFRLAAGQRNVCIVGDDDQALYRFRGATVENFVEFPARCQAAWGLSPRTIPLSTNYRSRQGIVRFYTTFIEQCNWQKAGKMGGAYRVQDKHITAHSADTGPAVVATDRLPPDQACGQIAALVRQILDEGKVSDPNQIAFLYPSLKSEQVRRMREALIAVGLHVYAPRAGRFLEVDEATALFGVYALIFGRPARGEFRGQDYADFHGWLDAAVAVAELLCREDAVLNRFVQDRQVELAEAAQNYRALQAVAARRGWDPTEPYDIDRMKRSLYEAPGLTERARRVIASARFERSVRARLARQDRPGAQPPFTLGYIITRATSIDWSVLDLFYRVCGCDHFRSMFDLAEAGTDEGPICNLGLISQYLGRFLEEYRAVITADLLVEGGFRNLFFMSYLFALFRLGESEYEDAEDPFPRGRIPFLTIHQSKGLEFPVVVLGNPRKDVRGPQRMEEVVRPLLERTGEPLDRQAEFDMMRLFYVALSRAQNLLVLAHWGGRGNRVSPPFDTLLGAGGDAITRIPQYSVDTLPAAGRRDEDVIRNYSYTGDFLNYQKCARQYMVFRKYGFTPARSQTMVFGSLVHRTLEDLHQYLIAEKDKAR